MIEKELICVNCPMGCRVHVQIENDKVISVTGNNCPRGKAYAEKECIRPERILTSTVRISGALHRVLPVITDREIPLDMIMDAMDAVRGIKVEAPVKVGDVIAADLLGTGVNLVASRSMEHI
jgi:CxxC motif-containing protein